MVVMREGCAVFMLPSQIHPVSLGIKLANSFPSRFYLYTNNTL